MAAQNMPAAEFDVTAGLVRALLREQHPDIAELPLTMFANGWDNAMFRLGDELVVRLPRRQVAARLIDHEQAVLPTLAPHLPLPIPAPVRSGRPSTAFGYPWPWSLVPWIPGRIVADSSLADSAREARRLGAFLAALHRPAPPDAPENRFRGHFIGDNAEVYAQRVDLLPDGHDRPGLLARWNELVDVAPWPHPPVWLHGDLHAANILADGGALSGVIDFGDVCAGDPATDLSLAWSLFDPDDRRTLRAAGGRAPFGVDDATWQRAEAWALYFAVTYLSHSADSPTMRGIGARILDALV